MTTDARDGAAAGRAIRVVRATMCAGMLASVAISGRVWVGEGTWGRTVPRVPWVDGLPGSLSSRPWDVVVFVGFCACVLAAGVLRRGVAGPAIAGAAVLGLLMGVQDVLRGQPWFFQYLLMLWVLLVHLMSQRRSAGAENGEGVATATLLALRLVVAAVYVYSGLHKVNHTFVHTTFAGLVDPVAAPLGLPVWIVRAGAYAVIPLEVFIGVGVLVPRMRAAAATAGTLMHAGIVLCLVLTSVNANAVVIPWNAAMVVIMWTLARAGTGRPADIRGVGVMWWAAVSPALVLACVMPALGVAGRWPAYLSWGMYGGREPHLAIGLTDDAMDGLPAELRPHLQPIAAERIRHAVTMMDWVAGETRARPFPEEWYLEALARKALPRFRGVGETLVVLYRKPDRWTGVRLEEAKPGTAYLPRLPGLAPR